MGERVAHWPLLQLLLSLVLGQPVPFVTIGPSDGGEAVRICEFGASSCPEYNGLSAYMRREGFEDTDIAIANFRGAVPGTTYRGLLTLKPKKKGDVLLSIPLSAMMSRVSAMDSTIGTVLRTLERIVSTRMIMALHLLYEKFEKERKESIPSKFKEFLSLLPDDTNSLLIFSPDDMEEFQCPSTDVCPALASVETQRKMGLHQINATASLVAPILIRNHVFDPATLSKRNLTWAYTTILARAFSLTRDPETPNGQSFLLAPFADLLNHHNIGPLSNSNYGYNITSRILRLSADRDYSENSEIFISYGQLTNPYLMLNYGFVLPDNVYESVGLKAEIPSTDPQYQSKLELLQEVLKAYPNATEARLSLTGEISDDFLKVLRIKHCRLPEENISLQTKADLCGISDPSVRDPSLEFRIHHDVLVNLESLLREYPTSLAYDVRVLKNWKELNISSRVLSAVMFRVEIKRILWSTMLETLRAIHESFVQSADLLSENSGNETDEWKTWREKSHKWDENYRKWRAALDSTWTEGKDLKKFFLEVLDVSDAITRAMKVHAQDTVRMVVDSLVNGDE